METGTLIKVVARIEAMIKAHDDDDHPLRYEWAEKSGAIGALTELSTYLQEIIDGNVASIEQ